MTQSTRSPSMPSDETEPFRVAFWNLQNLFDVESSAIAAELDFTPAFGWTRIALQQKIANLAAVINLMFDGAGPDLLGVCEMESESLADQLLEAISRKDLKLAHCPGEGTDALGTALFYSDRLFECDPARILGHRVLQRFPTRDILEVHLNVRRTDTDLSVYVNHWPSRGRDPRDTDPFRQTVARRCRQLIDQQLKLSRREYLELSDNSVALYQLNRCWDQNVLLMGDFNDEPWDASLRQGLNAGFSLRHMDDPIEMLNGSLPSWRSYSGHDVPLFNPMTPLAATPDRGSWFADSGSQRASLRNQFLLSRGLLLGRSGLKPVTTEGGLPAVSIFCPDVMADRDGHPIPFRTETLQGFSDHFPITMKLGEQSAS